jgi:BON domain-containing protein
MESRERYEPRERGGDGHEYDERERRRSGRQARREFSQDEPDYSWSSSGQQYRGYGSYRGPYGQGYGEEFSQFSPYGGDPYFGHGSELGQHQGWGQRGTYRQSPYGSQGWWGQGQYGQPGEFGRGGMYGQGPYGQGQYEQPGGMYRGSQGYGRMGQQGGFSGQSWGSQGQVSYRGKGPQNYKRSDERIKEDASECLTEHGMIDASGVDVSVSNGEVTLKGTVPDRHMKRMAEDAVENLSGVKEVHNQLRVQQEGKGQEEYEMAGSRSSQSSSTSGKSSYRSNT